jgi:DNA-binding transcriptional ArsR family regulator
VKESSSIGLRLRRLCDLCGPLLRPAISKHLRLLRNAGLVVNHKAGTARICDLNAKPLRAVNAWLRDYEAFWGESMRSLKSYIEEAEHQKKKDL